MIRDPAEHVAMERLAAYRAGALPSEEAEAVQDHLAACRKCASALLDLARYGTMMESEEPLPSGPGVPAPEQTEAGWQRLRARLGPAGEEKGQQRQQGRQGHEASGMSLKSLRSFGSLRSFFPPARVLSPALAAALVLCLIGFPLWIATHRNAPAPLGLAVPGAEVHRGTGGAMPPLTVHLGAGPSVLAVPLPDREPFPTYSVEILSLQGTLRLTAMTTPVPVAKAPAIDAAERSQVVTVILPAASLPVGEYRLRLVGVHREAGEVLAEHTLRVEP